MKIKATVLIDNYAFGINGVLAQHGWSMFLETEQGNYLLDTGAGRILVGNARVLGIDLDSIQGVILVIVLVVGTAVVLALSVGRHRRG